MERINDTEFMNILDATSPTDLRRSTRDLLYELFCRNQELSARVADLEERLDS